MARKQAKPKAKPPIYKLVTTYRGKPVQFVDKLGIELLPEIRRLGARILVCQGLAQRCRRRWHPVIEAVCTHLQILRPDEQTSDLPAEICRLNLGLEDGLYIINQLKLCDLPDVKNLRFALTYSQTHRKQDRQGFKEDRNVIYANEPKAEHEQVEISG